MEPSKRIVINTIAQYTRSFINTLLSLYTVRIILQALGKDDYGIYVLVAGIVAMLGFVTNAMVITTQRHFSFYYGQGDKHKVKQVFSNSFFLHICIALFLMVLMLSLRDYIFSGRLNIVEERKYVASQIYLMSVAMLMLSFIVAPFKALFIAKENIVYISVVDVCDGVLKFVFAVTLFQLNVDKLLMYGLMMLFITLVQFFAYSVYSFIRFEECQLRYICKDINKRCLLSLMGFAGWTTYGMGTIVLRTQGLSVLFNMFYGTAMNAAYGIGQQLYSSVSFISSSVLNAINPQIVKAEGERNRERVFNLAAKESKFVTAMMAIVFIPLCFEMDNLLVVWLKDVPSYSSLFCRCLLIAFIIDQMTYGLNTANQAIGRIRNYTLLMYTPKIILIFLVFWMLHSGATVTEVMILYIIIELIVALMRIPYMHYVGGLCVSNFCREVFLCLTPLFLCLVGASYLLCFVSSDVFRFFYTIPISVLTGVFVAWKVVFSASERKHISMMIQKKIKG